MDTRAKETAEALLDLYAVGGADDAPDLEDHVFQAVVERLSDADAFSATMDDEGELRLDVTPLLIATTLVTRWLVQRAGEASESSEQEVVFDLRAYISRLTEDGEL